MQSGGILLLVNGNNRHQSGVIGLPSAFLPIRIPQKSSFRLQPQRDPLWGLRET